MLKLRILNVSWNELKNDLGEAVDLDRSALFKLVYETEYGTYDGDPCSLIVADFEIDGNADIILLRQLAQIAAAAHAPLLCAAGPGLLGVSEFKTLEKLPYPERLFASPELAQWREFRMLEDSRYVSVVLPHVLLHATDTTRSDDAQGDAVNSSLWGNACYFLAGRIADAFSRYAWPAAFGRSVQNDASSDTSNRSMQASVLDADIGDDQVRAFEDNGLIALSLRDGSIKIAHLNGQPDPGRTNREMNAHISATLPYMLAASRFAHYIKVIMRNKVGSFLTRANVEGYLNNWIANYVLLDDNPAEEVCAAYPLRVASVVVTDVPGEPGVYCATLFIKPHFHLKELATSIRIVVNLPS